MPNKKKLYEALKAEGYDNFADESSFNAYVDNADNRKKLFSALKQEGYDNFADETEFEKYLGYNNSEDDAAFEANAERFRSGQPIERVTTQSVIDANPELGLQTNAVQPEVDQTQQYIMNNKPTIFGGKKKSLMDVPLNVSPDAIEGGENLEKLSERARIAEHNMKDPFVQKARTEADVRGLASEIDGLLEKSVQEERASVGGSAFMPAGARGRAYTEANKERVKEVTDLSSAKRLLDQSQYIIDAAKRGDTGILKDTWQGFKDSLEAEDFTFGLADAASSASILDAIKKVENGEELTEAEDKLLRASAINMATQYYYANDLNRAYKAGQVSAESVPFMLEMAINPISSLGKASAKTLLNYGLKSYAKQVGKGLAKGAAAGTGMALTTGLGRVAAGTTDRLAEGYNYGVDFDGNLYAKKKEDAMGVGEAVARSLASTAIENQSEMIFNAFKGFGGFMKGVQDVLPGGVNKFFDMLSHNKVADAYRVIKNSPVFRNYLVKDIRNATQIGGLGEEYLEEVYNNIANAAIGEMKWEDVVSLDKNIDTLLGLAPTQVMFGLLGLGGAGAMRYQTRKTLEDLQATMNEQQRKDLEGLLDMGLDAKEVDVRGFIRNVMQNESYTIENKRDLIKAAYNVAKQNGIDELTEADTIEKVNAENSLIDSVTDPSTGIYTEITATLPDAKEGTIEVPGYVVGWLGEGEKRQPIFVQEGMENTYENRRVLKPGQWSEEAVQQMPAEEVKAINEEMIREEAAKQAEQEAKYAPEVLNAQMQQGVPFDTPNAQIVPVAPMPEGNGWIVEEYALDTNNKVAKTPIVRELTNDEYRDMLQAQLNAEEAAQKQLEEQAAAQEVIEETQPTEEADVKENLTTESGDNLSPVEEVAQPQAQVIPTKEDGSIDFVSYGKEGTFKTLGEKYGEKMPNKVSVTAKALAEDLKKAQNKLQKAEEAYDNAPIGREQKAEEARDKAKQELEAIQREANFWAEMDAEIKDAQARRESMLNPQAEVETSTEPMNVDEFVAQQLASGNIVLDKEDYKKETGYGDTEANAMNGGATKLFGKNGMTIQEAGERLMEIDRENGTNFFDQLDSNSGRDALINVLGSVKSRKELNQYIATNRAEQAKRETEGLRNELEKQAMEANYASLEDYVLQMEVEEMENPFLNDRADEIMAIFAEEAAKYEQLLNNTENGQGTENEVVEGNDSILPEEQLDNTGGTEVSEESERIGDGTSEESEGTYAEEVKEPLRNRAKDWENKLGVKVNLIESIDQVTNREALRAIQNGQIVTGWFEESTGEVCFYMPYLESENEVDSTYIHEVVAHKGLRELLGDKFDAFCDEVWDMMSNADRLKFMAYPGVSHLEGKEKARAAADEYIAHLSENIDVTDSAWNQLTELIKKFLKAIGLEPKMTNADIANAIKKSYQRLLEGEGGASLVGEGTRFNAKKVSDRRQDRNRVNNTVDQAVAFVMGKDVKEVKAERLEKEQKRKEEAEEIYQSVLSGDFNDVTLQKINDYIDDATPLHPYGQRISQRLPQKLERGLHEGARTNAVDALFSRICESAVPASRRASEAGRREIEERKKEALKGWAIATNNWHTDLSDFADEEDFIRQGTDSKVYLAKDGKHVIKVSFGKPEGKRFRPDIDTTALFNSVFRNTAYEIVGYGEFDGKFARILKQPFVDFADKTALNADEREEYMRTLGFEPINESRTAFSNGSIIAADLQKSNILKDAAGNISVIDADMKLHTKDVGGNYTYPPVEADLPEGKLSFRVVSDKNGKKTLVGLHNISEEKLKKAIKQGGLANPSMAVIDMDKQSHVDYGGITLVASADLIDKNTGRSAGTYMGDAWTPVYPTVVKKLSEKGGKALTKALESVDETFRSKVRTYFDSYLETGTPYDALAYWYLSDTGKNPPILEAALPEGFTKEEVEKVKSINSEADSFFQLSEDEKQKALFLYADKFFKGIKEYEEHLADYTKRMQEVVKDESKPQFVRKNIQQNLNAIERYGYEYDRVAGYYNRAVFLASRQSKPSEFETFRNAFDEVSKNGLEEDFGNWMTAKEAELGVEEKLFAGYDNQGRAKYLPNTLENASKLMKKEGRAGATGLGGFNYFVDILAPVAKTTKEINKKKGNLSTQEEYDAFAKKWSEYYHDLALQLQPGADKWADYGYHRLHEIAPMSNPKDYVKREYGIELSDRFIKDLNEVKTAIKNDFPARYFETKFERPIYLNEFAAAVIPQGTSKDVVDALTEAGLPIEEYESGNNEARMAAIDKVSSEIEGIRFRVKFTPEEQTIIKNAKNDGSYMKAPNGKPTNLNEKRWAQVRTKAFKTWFGDWEKNPKKSSLMIDENGEPKVFYHGSPSRFNEFISDKMGETGTSFGQGFYFSPEKRVAEGYVGENGGTLYEVFLNLRKPISDSKKTLKKPSIKRFIDEIDKRMMKRDDDGIGILDNWNDVSYYGRNKVLNEATEAVFEYNATDLEIVGDLINTSGSYDIVTEVLRDILGFDGVLPSNTDREVIVHHPNQIKSATDNVGTFDEGNNDIRFRFIGERGARNLDKAEEATTRLDNLNVAREMEAAEKDAKTIKMATGWERGADGLWRYETMDSETAIKDDDEAEIRRQIEAIEEEEKAYKKKAREEGIGPDEREEAYINFYRRRGFLEAQLAYVMVKNADVLTHISTSLYHVLDKENSENLFKAYPELEFVKVGFATELVGKSLGATVINGSRIEAINLDVKRSTPEELNGYLAHEIQHAIQEIEGFAPGGAPSMESPRKAEQKAKNISFMKDKLDKSVSERNSLLKQRNEINDKMSAWWDTHEDATREDMFADKDMQQYNREYDELSKQIDEADKTVKFNERWLDATLQANTALGYEGYKKLAGEVEARNVTSRLGMTLEQRRNSLASETEDVAREDQIFLKDGIESGMRFRLSEKGKQIQAEVDKFTSKYNSKPVELIDPEMTDEEIEDAIDWQQTAKDLKAYIKESKSMGGYVGELDKILIFVENMKLERMEEAMFHENLHPFVDGGEYNHLLNKLYENGKDDEALSRARRFSDREPKAKRPLEFFNYAVSYGQVNGNLDDVLKYFDKEEQAELLNLLKENGYDYYQEQEGRRGNAVLDGLPRGEENAERVLQHQEGGQENNGRVSSESQEEKISPTERKARLNELFSKVSDMGLQGVLGNKEYTSLMVDIYKALPEEVRAEIAEDAIRLYGGSVAPAVSDYIGPKSKNSIMDKVVTIVREALRKIGFDLDLNANEVRYMAWRSKKPLDRNNMFEVAEDIDMKYRLKVGEYDGTTPDGGGTRFRAKEPEKIDIADKRSPIIKKYDETLKTGMFNFQEAFQDRMLSLKVLMDVIVGATGKEAKSFEDAYEAENQLSSTNKVDQERYIKKFYTPLVDYLKELSKKHGEEIVRRYIYCKSGLERNEVLRQRDADEAFNSAKEELDEKLAKNQLTQAQYDALLQQAEDERLKTLSEDVDYSGIRGMLFNVRAQELFEQYQSGALTEVQYKQKIDELKNKKADVVKNWKDFAIISVADLESRATSAELDELWSKINAATNETLRIDFESGMIDRETYEAEKNMMKYYVPLRDWENTKAEEMYEYRHDMTPAVSSNQKKAKGRESEAANPMATIALMAQNAIVRGNRNKMKQKLYSFVVNRPNDLASVRNVWYVRDANNQWEAQYANTSAASNQEEANQIIEQFEANMEVLAAQGDAFKGKLKQGMGYRASRKQKDEHVVAVMINGKEYGVYINGNPRAAQAVNGLTNAENVDDGYAWIDNLKRLYGGSLTSWDPNFVVPNFVRDTIHASTMTFLDRGVLGAVQYMANIPKIFAQVSAEISGLSIGNAKLHQYFEEFVNNGGETGYTEVHTLEDYKKEYQKLMNEAKGLKAGIKKGFKLPFQKMAKVLETANRIAEDVNRFNAYVTSREAGENIVNSIDAAKNITVNFNRKGALHANSSVYGKVASFMSRWILFFNPSVQGIYQLVSKSKMNPKRATALGATIIASGFFMPLLNEMLVFAFGGGDEDDYWNQSDFKRRNNWMLFTGDGYVSIPLPPVLREIYGMGDIIYGVMTGHIPLQRAIYDVMNQVQSAIGFVTLLPEVSQEPDVQTWLKGFGADLASPFLDVMSNTNFMGRPIAKWTDYNESDPEHERVYKGVGKHWVGLSELLNEMGGNETRRSDWWGNMINPAMMEHLVTSYTGGIGKTINNLIGMTIDAIEGDRENMDVFRKAPIVPRFYTPNDEKTVYPGINRKFYEFEYQYNNAKKSLKKSQDGVNSGEHPEWQKYIDEMDKNGEKKFIEYFKKEQKKLKKLQDKLKEDPNNKELEKKVYDKKAEISAESFKILSGQK